MWKVRQLEFLVIGALLFLLIQSQSGASTVSSGTSDGSSAANSITSPVIGTGGTVNRDAPYATGSVDEGFAQASATCGAGSTVLRALVAHETGNYTSQLWKRANNAGGLKYQTAPIYGHNWGYVLADDDAPGEKFAAFPTQAEGIAAVGRFLSTTRYAALRETSDPLGQIRAIAKAGYATDPTWPSKVWAKYQELASGTARTVASASTTGTADYAGGLSLLSSAVSAWSSSRQGDSNSDTTPETPPDPDPEFNFDDDPDFQL